ILYYQKEWTAERTKAMLNAVPKGKMTILDYFCENREVWRTRDKFSGQPYIWCYLGNFGGNTVFEGNPKKACERIDGTLKEGGKNFVGIGSTLEGFDVQQVPYERVLEKAWSVSEDSTIVVNGIADRHAGKVSDKARKAWDILYNDVYTLQAGTRGEMVSLRPLMNKEIYKTKYKINNPKLLEAWQLLIGQDEVTRDAMVIDITVTGRELLNQVFVVQKKEFEKAFTEKDLATMRKCATLMREIVKDIDGINAFQSHCTLDSWINLARDYGNTPELKDYYQKNALTLITTWGGSLNDYANRSYNGLMSQYHAVRWNMFINRAFDCVNNGKEWNDDEWVKEVKAFEKGFTYDAKQVTEPTTDLLTYCRLLESKYQPYFTELTK
ncbi:MAG: alpha-N-acetylglucosaminidase C-terminal domain-containing protein, partial [Bacteroidales bacterium]|nr:alpha-N-acetylglucosaminidase C-terminal domain-containing protein [Candidatus Sodaliphilus fimicaballi]